MMVRTGLGEIIKSNAQFGMNAKWGFETGWVLLRVDGYEMLPLAG